MKSTRDHRNRIDHDGKDPILLFALFIHHVLLGILDYLKEGYFRPMTFTVTVSSHCITMLRNDIQDSVINNSMLSVVY